MTRSTTRLVQVSVVVQDKKGQPVIGLGRILSSEKQHKGVNLEEKQFEYLARAAMVLDKHVTVQPRSAEVRVVDRDATSGI